MHFILSSIRNKLLIITGVGTTLVLLAALFGFWASHQGLNQMAQIIGQPDATQERGVNEQLNHITEVTEQTRSRMNTALIFMALAIAFAFGSFLTYIQRQIVNPAHRLSHSLQRMAERDFSTAIPSLGDDELGQIADSAETIRQAMSTIVNELDQSSGQLEISAAQLQEVIAITRQGVEQQLRETSQVAESIGHMTNTMYQVAEQAQQAAESAREADQDAGKGHQVVTQTINDINSLSQEIAQAGSTVEGLKQRSEEIGAVLDVIQGISEQTNLLALNAAIEAARAGEQGRGFAVVADEVRALATRTQKATEEVEAMIAQLQQGAQQVVAVMEQSRHHTQQSAQQSNEAGNSLKAITAAVERISQMNAHIATASSEQQGVAEEINRNIMNISEIAEHSAEGSKRIDEANSQLNSISQRLSALVASFRLS